MGIGNILVLSQVTSFVLAVILSFFIFPPAAVNKVHNFNGHCLLNAKGHYVYDVESRDFVVDHWGNVGTCSFAIFVGVAVMLISTFQIVRLSFHLYYDTDGNFCTTFLSSVFNVILTIMLFASSLTVAQGYNVWCKQLEQDPNVVCANAPFISRIWTSLPDISPSGFPVQWGLVQFGLWSSFLVWLISTLLSLVKLHKLHTHEHILRSLERERYRLLGQDRGPEVY